MYRDIKSGFEGRLKLKTGIDRAVNTIRPTMGVNGKSVMLDTHPHQKPLITNDGVSIIRELIFDDEFENAGLKLIKEVAEKTNDNAGDGTTTASLLTQAMIEHGMQALQSGAQATDLRDGIKEAVKEIISKVEKEKIEALTEEDLASVATISCRDEALGKLIAKIVSEAGVDGIITIEDSFDPETSYEQLEGIKLRGGYLHELFVNNPQRQHTVFNNVPILVTNKTITMAEEMGRIMETVANMGKKEAIVIAAGIEGDALATAAINWNKKAISILPVRVLAYGDLGEGVLKDVAAITGATYLDHQEKNIIDVMASDFGQASKIVTDKHETTIVSEDEKLKRKQIKLLENSLENSREFEQENIKQRIAKLKSAMFTIKVGGKTDSERNELKTRVDDAIKAASAALEEGIVAGGGSALYRAVQGCKVNNLGSSIVYKACLAPIEQMAENSGFKLDRSDLNAIKDSKKAIDFSTGEVVSAFKDGIIDPYKVIRECLENAAATAALFLTMESTVVTIEAPKEEMI